jgi:hypothetical protein
MKKLVKLAAVREALDAYGYKEVSYSRMVEMINEQANKELEKLLEQLVCDECDGSGWYGIYAGEPSDTIVDNCSTCNPNAIQYPT